MQIKMQKRAKENSKSIPSPPRFNIIGEGFVDADVSALMDNLRRMIVRSKGCSKKGGDK